MIVISDNCVCVFVGAWHLQALRVRPNGARILRNCYKSCTSARTEPLPTRATPATSAGNEVSDNYAGVLKSHAVARQLANLTAIVGLQKSEQLLSLATGR